MMPRPLALDRSGATAVEFALLLPLLLTLLTGILEFGRAMWMRQDMQFAVEEAARYALVEDAATATAVSARALQRLGAVGPANAGITVTTTLATDSVTVVASTDFSPIMPGLLPPGSIQLSARARLPR